MARYFFAFFAMFFLGLSSAARADDAALVQRFLGNSKLQQYVISQAKLSDVVSHDRCKDAKFAIAGTPQVLKPLAFDSDGAPVAGMLLFAVKDDGCGISRNLNVFIVVKAKDKVAGASLLPGSTHADPVLQRDALMPAFAWAVGEAHTNKRCQTRYVEDTQFIAYDKPAAKDKGSPWDEKWTLVLCSKRVTVSLSFIPDATGTTFVVNSKKGSVEKRG